MSKPAEEQQAIDLMGLLVRVADRCDCGPTKADEVQHWALGFAMKLIAHSSSVMTLLRQGSRLHEGMEAFLDRTSICVLVRAAWECFLLFHHIFVDPPTDALRELRYLRWSIESPRRRQSFEALLDGQKEQQALEAGELDKTESRLRSSFAFREMTAKEQKTFLKRGDRWRPGFSELAEKAGISKLLASDNYSFLCDHAHTGWISVAGLHSRLSTAEEEILRATACGLLTIAAANMIVQLGALFPGVPDAVSATEHELVARWVNCGREPLSATGKS